MNSFQNAFGRIFTTKALLKIICLLIGLLFVGEVHALKLAEQTVPTSDFVSP